MEEWEPRPEVTLLLMDTGTSDALTESTGVGGPAWAMNATRLDRSWENRGELAAEGDSAGSTCIYESWECDQRSVSTEFDVKCRIFLTLSSVSRN